MAIDIVLRLLGNSESARQAISGTKEEADKLTDSVEKATDSIGKLHSAFENARNWGAGMAAAGAAGMVLANNLSDAFVEADRLSGRLESLMRGKGLADGIDQVRALGAEIAGLTGGDDDAIATGIAEAVASGRLTSLKQYGIAIDAVGMSAIEAAGKVSDQAKSQEVLNQVLRNGKIAADNLRDGMDEGTAKLGELDVRMGNLQEGFGRGATKIKAAVLGGILEPIYSILETSPALQETTGAFLTIGSGALTAGGSVLGLAAQIGMATAAFPALGVSGTAAMASISAASVPVIIALGQILAVALLAAAAIYALDKALHWKEDRELQANIKRGEETERQTYDHYVRMETKKGKPVKSFEKWQEDPNADDPSGGGAADIDNLQRQADALKTPPAPPVPPPVYAMPAIPPIRTQVVPSVGPPIPKNETPTRNGLLPTIGQFLPAKPSPVVPVDTVTGSSGNAAVDGIRAARGGFGLLGNGQNSPRGGSASGGGDRAGGPLEVYATTKSSINSLGQQVVKVIVPDIIVRNGRLETNVNGLRN